MGSQSSIVLAGLLLLHIALILTVVSLATPNWIEGSTFNYTSFNLTNSTNVTTKGLWQVCSDGDCEPISHTQPVWFSAARGVFTAGVALIFVALVLSFAFFGVDSLRGSVLNALIIFTILAADAALLSGLIVFGLHAIGGSTEVFPPIDFGWSYWVGVAGLGVSVLTSGLILREACLLKKEVKPYITLTKEVV